MLRLFDLSRPPLRLLPLLVWLAACGEADPPVEVAPFAEIILPDSIEQSDIGSDDELPVDTGPCEPGFVKNAFGFPGGRAGSLSIAWSGAGFVAGYIVDQSGGLADVEVTLHDSTGWRTAGPFSVSESLGEVGRHAIGRVQVAGRPNGYAVAWLSSEPVATGKAKQLYFATLDGLGAPLSSPIRVHPLWTWLQCPECPPQTGDECGGEGCQSVFGVNPRVVWVGDKYLLTYSQGGQGFYYARQTFSGAGQPQAAKPVLALQPGAALDAFAQAGWETSAALLWVQTSFPSETQSLRYAVSSYGNAFEVIGGTAVVDDADTKQHLAAATNDDGYLFGWSTIAGGDTPAGARRLHVLPVGPLGQPIGEPVTIAETTKGQEAPFGSLRVVGNSGGYVAAWSVLAEAVGTVGRYDTIEAARIEPSGEVSAAATWTPEDPLVARGLHQPAVIGKRVLVPVEVQSMGEAPAVHLLTLCMDEL